MKPAKDSGAAWVSNSPRNMCGQVPQREPGQERWHVDYRSLSSVSGPGRAHKGASRDWRTWCATSETRKPHTKQEETGSHPKKVSKSALFSCPALGREATWNKPLHSHSHPRAPRLPPSQAIEFQTIGQWIHKAEKWRLIGIWGQGNARNKKHCYSKSEKRFFSQDMWLFPGPRWSRVSHLTQEIKLLFSNSKHNATWVPSQNAPYTSNKLSREPGYMVVQGFLK